MACEGERLKFRDRSPQKEFPKSRCNRLNRISQFNQFVEESSADRGKSRDRTNPHNCQKNEIFNEDRRAIISEETSRQSGKLHNHHRGFQKWTGRNRYLNFI